MVAQDIWSWAISRNNYLTSAHIPGKINVEADLESRKVEFHMEWKLKPSLFEHACRVLNFYPEVDLFASRLNNQLPNFFSYRPDPKCIGVDAFSETWDMPFYAFPPFATLPRVIQKIEFDKSQGILITPDWPSQPWYTRLKYITIQSTILFPRNDMLSLPSNSQAEHPLAEKLHLRCSLVSGRI